MSNKTFNFYCDESCHLENDRMPFMLIGYVSCAYNQVKLHSSNIKNLKKKYNIYYEIKWSGLSKSAYPLYNELIEYFFATDLQFRAIVIDKSKIKLNDFHQSHDDFYYRMYYQLLNKKIAPDNNYNIYLDIKDSKSSEKVNGLKNYLNSQYISVRNLQNIRSYESELMQMADILTGALSYNLRGLTEANNVIAKQKIIDKIKSHCEYPITKSTNFYHEKFNLFFIDLK